MLPNYQKNKKRSPFKIIIYSVLSWFLLLMIFGFLAYMNVQIKNRREKLNEAISNLKKEIEILENKNKDMKEKISDTGAKENIEKIAREQFGLKAQGEEVVVISKENNNQEKENNGDVGIETKNNKAWWNPVNWLGWMIGAFKREN